MKKGKKNKTNKQKKKKKKTDGLIYLDDVIIFTTAFEEHLERLDAVPQESLYHRSFQGDTSVVVLFDLCFGVYFCAV